jgi:thiamine pyrophosphokinase
LSAVGSERQFDIPAGTTVSLLPMTLCEGVMTKGLKWELRYESLALGQREGTSNVVVSAPVTVKVRRGELLMYRVTTRASVRAVRRNG